MRQFVAVLRSKKCIWREHRVKVERSLTGHDNIVTRYQTKRDDMCGQTSVTIDINRGA